MRTLRAVSVSMVLIYGAILVFFSCAETSFIFFPDYPSRRLTPVATPHQDVHLTASDGTQLHAWTIPSATPSDLWMIMFHGNAGNISDRDDYYNGVRQIGLNILAPEYRGYGRSEGSPDEKGLYLDALASYDYLVDTLRVKPGSIVVFGHSLGSAVAVYLAVERETAALVLEGSLTSVADRGQELYPFLPVRLLVRNKFDSIGRIQQIHCPVLFLHAEQDEVIPVAHGKKMFERAGEPKSFVTLSNHHNDAMLDPAYFPSIREFLMKYNVLR